MGKVIFQFEDDISTDIIYPGRFMATVLPTETPQFAFADNKDLNKMLVNKEFSENDIIIAGKNFGCGSSREQAVSTIKGHGVTIIARNFARIFIQNSVNLGLNTITAPDYQAELGDEIEVLADKVINKTSGKEYAVIPHSAARQQIIDAGGLIAYTRKILIDKNK
jgi:3-isopropylmalate/(R)-2-methylmalate dehydratase small subunit